MIFQGVINKHFIELRILKEVLFNIWNIDFRKAFINKNHSTKSLAIKL